MIRPKSLNAADAALKKTVKTRFLPRFLAFIADPLERLLEKRSSHKKSVAVVRGDSSLWYQLPKIFFNR